MDIHIEETYILSINPRELFVLLLSLESVMHHPQMSKEVKEEATTIHDRISEYNKED